MTTRRCEECGARLKEPEAKDQHDGTCVHAIHYVAVRPYEAQGNDPGRRLRIQQDDPKDLIVISDETTLPERVARIDARHKTLHDSLVLTEDEAEWMRNRLIEVTSGDLVFVALTREEWARIVEALHVISDVAFDDVTQKLERQVIAS